MYHGQEGETNPRGWRISYIPCGRRPQHYPNNARAARPLEPHEYVPSHPRYRPLVEETTETADVSGVTEYSEYADVAGATTSTFGEVQQEQEGQQGGQQVGRRR